MKKTATLIIVAGIMGGLVFISTIFASSDPDRFWFKPENFKEYGHSFCAYSMPASYEMVDYTHGIQDEREMVVLRSNTQNNIIVLVKLSEFPKINLQEVRTSNESVRMTMDHQDSQILKHFKMLYLWPVFKTDKIQYFGNDLTIRGIKVRNKEEINTAEFNSVLISGSFHKIGLYKNSPDIFKQLIIPVFDFENPSEGYFAVIRNKTNGAVFFVISVSAPQGKTDDSVFKEFLKTLSFHNTNRPPYPETNYKKVQTKLGPFQSTKEYLNDKEIKK